MCLWIQHHLGARSPAFGDELGAFYQAVLACIDESRQYDLLKISSAVEQHTFGNSVVRCNNCV